jgi:peptidoglycan hydrolase-like protein with peptidoglycan-binding domain
MAVDDTFDESTEQAVIAWQTSLGTTADGSVSPFELIYVPGPVKVGSPAEGVELGSSVPVGSLITDLVPVSRVVFEGDGSETLASTQQIVVTMPVDDRDLIEVGASVVVELADGTDIDATVISIAAPVSGDSGSTVSVVIAPTVPLDDAWTGTSVSVEVTTEVASGVLAVPVSALLALVEGGYALEVVQPDGSTELIGVETGMFADGLVEVTATGLMDGMSVVVPG